MFFAAAFIAPLAACAAVCKTDEKPVEIDPSVRLQRWDGWGTSLCWWANVVGGYPDDVRREALRRVFKDLRFNIVRFNIGGGENPEHHHLEKRAEMPGYLSKTQQWDWSADQNQRRVLLEARRLGVDRFEAFSNSPPYWMTKSGCAAGNADAADNLDPARYDEFADYLTEVVKHYRDEWGVVFETLDPMNEPGAHYWPYGGRQEGCQIDIGAHQSELILATAKALERKQLETKISACDESNIDFAVTSWDHLTPEARKEVWRLNTHAYGGSAQAAIHERATRDGKRLWMSEYGDGDGSGMTMARQIVRDLHLMQPTAWVYWQAVEPSGNGWGLLSMDFDGGRTVAKNDKFYVMSCFSKFLKPGAQFVAVSDQNSVAALVGRDLVIVTVNSGPEREAAFDLTKFEAGDLAAKVYRSTEREKLGSSPALRVRGGFLKASLAADSVTTFVISPSR
jgi:O-glycosyl hydrolase